MAYETLLINTMTSECELFDSLREAQQRYIELNSAKYFVIPCIESKDGAELLLYSNATEGATFRYVAEIVDDSAIWDDFLNTADVPVTYKEI